MKCLIASLLFCIFLFQAIGAAETSKGTIPLRLSLANELSDIGKFVQYYEDREGVINVVNAIRIGSEKWSSIGTGVPSFGYTDSAYWLNFNIQNDTNDKFWLLNIDFSRFDDIKVYAYKNNELVKRLNAGAKQNFDQRYVQYHTFIFPLEFESNSTYQVYVRLKSQDAMQFPMKLQTPKTFWEIHSKKTSLEHLYFGAMMAIAFFHFFLSIKTRKPKLLFYIGFLVCFSLANFTTMGFAYQYLWSNSPDFNLYIVNFLSSMAAVCLFFYLIDFLELKKISTTAHSAFKIAIAAYVFFAFLSLIIPLHVYFSIVGVSYILTAGILSTLLYTIRKKHSEAIYIFYSFIFVAVGVMMFFANKAALIPYNAITEYGMLVGSFIQAILISFAIGNQFNNQVVEKNRARTRYLEEALQRQDIEKKLLHKVIHDGLTGLPARNYFRKFCKRLLDNEVQPGRYYNLYFFKIGGLKSVNNLLGHSYGDEVIVKLINNIESILSHYEEVLVVDNDSNTETRIFAIEGVIFAYLESSRTVQENVKFSDAEHIKQIIAKLTKPFIHESIQIELHPKAVVVPSINDISDVETLLKNGFVALDAAKDYHTKCLIYNEEFTHRRRNRLNYIEDLKNAINKNQFLLFYQPKIDTTTGQCHSAEALIRWHHPDRGMVPPNDFISLAEDIGLITDITFWVIREAALFQKHLDSKNISLAMHINLSTRDLMNNSLYKHIQNTFDMFSLKPQQFTFELTETSMMENQEKCMRFIHDITQYGSNVAIDDFGIGYSSLSYLKEIPANELKLDRSFISDLLSNKKDYSIVESTINMCHDLGLEVTAEGVEDVETSNILRSLKCDNIQGYFIAKPLNGDDFINWFQTYTDSLKHQNLTETPQV